MSASTSEEFKRQTRSSTNSSNTNLKKFPSCCVKNCDEFFKDQNRKFVKFPEKEEKRKVWMEIVGLDTVTELTRICDKHFTSKDYENDLKLSSLAVPSLNLDIVLELKIKTELDDEFGHSQDPLRNFIRLVEIKYEEQDSIDQICRICLKKEDAMIWLFDPHQMEENVAELYRFCTGLDVSENDKFSQHICNVCFCKLEESYKLKKTSIKSYETLKSRLEQMEAENYQRALNRYSDEIKEETEDRIEDEKPPETKQKEVSNPLNPIFFCDYCQKDLQVNKDYHVWRHGKNKKKAVRKCEVCRKAFYIIKDFESHRCKQLAKICEPCQLSFNRVEELQKHLKETHFVNGVYTCTNADCPEKYTTTSGLSAYHHIRGHTYKLEKICDICGKIFKDMYAFSIHKSVHKKHVPYTCDHCGLKVKGKNNMMRHILVKHQNYRAQCEFCEASYKTKVKLNMHKIRKHGMPAPYKCVKCEKGYLQPSMLKVHLKGNCAPARPSKEPNESYMYY